MCSKQSLQTFESLYIWNSYLEGEMIKFKDFTINEEQFDYLNETANQKYENFIALMSKTSVYLQKEPVIDAFTTCINLLKQLHT